MPGTCSSNGLDTAAWMDERLKANRDSWDERTAVHLESRFYDVEGWLHESRGPRSRELEVLGDVSGLRLLHLQCHFGLDTLAWARVGAFVTGLDFSPAAIASALELAERSGLAQRAEFVCAEVYDAVEALGGAKLRHRLCQPRGTLLAAECRPLGRTRSDPSRTRRSLLHPRRPSLRRRTGRGPIGSRERLFRGGSALCR